MQRSLIFIFIVLISAGTLARNDSIVWVNKPSEVNAIEFIKDLEKKYSLRFFFKDEWLDTIMIHVPGSRFSLSEFLSNEFEKHGIYFLQSGNQIIFLEGMPLKMEISFVYEEGSGGDTTDIVSEIAEKKTLDVYSLRDAKESETIVIGSSNEKNKSGTVNLTGYIRDKKTGEAVIGATIFNSKIETGSVTDVNGFFVLPLPVGQHKLVVRSIGMKERSIDILLQGAGSLNIEMEEELIALKEVVVEAEKYHNVTGMQMGLSKIDIKTIKEIPLAMGENDVMKVALLLPGVQTVGEGASGFNVRGGSTDQNLVMIDKAPVFNTSHFFGFFSVFNPDIIKDFSLYKSGIPAEFGGRISSVFDISSKDGNKKKISGGGGVSPVTARLYIEGPVIKEKGSFIVAGRSTYSDWILRQLEKADLRNSDAGFYDINAKFDLFINQNNNLNFAVYQSNDYFTLNSLTSYHYKNNSLSLSWRHKFNHKLILKSSGISSDYAYRIFSTREAVDAYQLSYNIKYREAKTVFNYYPFQNHKMNFGFNAIHYKLNPGEYLPRGSESLLKPILLDEERGLETAVFISDSYELNSRLSLYGGLRYSSFFYLGPGKVYYYYDDGPIMKSTIRDSIHYKRNELIHRYGGPEIRFFARYAMNTNSSIKLSFNRMRQYLQMLSNTTAISPTDTWKLSDSHIRPQVGDQWAIGFYQNLRRNTIESSVELYYKKIHDIIEYKNGAELLLNDYIETDLINAQGYAYGAEILFRKNVGRLNGWLSYTYSRILIKADSEFDDEKINQGEWFPANYDKPHDFTAVLNYKFSRRIGVSSNLTYSTGRPITYPAAKYQFRDVYRLHYSYRNEFRIPDYFRWDISVNLEGNLKSEKLAHGSWSLSVYNVTGRKNVYSVYFITKGGKVNGYKLSVFGQPIPTLTYNFRF